ncbi:protein SET DOMAIN GROUP 40 [Nymphaea colorata]|nr:protein SET DOMAIN GROUP 40 [Nymphaea colorata]
MGDQELAEFLRWGAMVGISDAPPGFPPCSSCLGHTLCISNFPDAGGRGLAAARELRKGETILKVPRRALMCRDSVLEGDKCLAASVERYPHLSPTQVLAVCLLSEVCKGRDSQWYPYLIQLPRSYDLLVNFGQFEVQAFQVDDAIYASKQAVSKVQYDWKEAKRLMEDISLRPQFLTFRSWLWAFATISSRTLHIPWDKAGCLCPVGDLFNYEAPGIDAPTLDNEVNEDFNRLTDGGCEEDRNAYCFYARQSYSRGEQVLLRYGTYSNLELLEHYGFLLKHNPNDKVLIQYQSGKLSWTREALHIQSDGKPSFALLCAMRLSIIPPNQRKAVGHLAHAGLMLSVVNEIAVMKSLSKLCEDLLSKLPSSMEEDCLLLEAVENIHSDFLYSHLHSNKDMVVTDQLNAFLQTHDLKKEHILELPWPKRAERSLGRWKLAVQWRLGYKKILHSCIRHCSETIEHLVSDINEPAT